MIVIGLTGSIGMGKTTVARQFAGMRAAVLDSDAVVHRLLGQHGAAVEAVERAFPGVREGDHINRRRLGEMVFADEEKLKALERILHPLVRKAQDEFIRISRLRGRKIVVLDIPLLFETGGERRCDYTLVATAPSFIQRQRVLKRMHMSEEKLARILARQMTAREKCRRADFVVQTGLGKYLSRKMVRRIMAIIKK